MPSSTPETGERTLDVLLNDDLSGVLDTVIAGYTSPASGILTYLDPKQSFLYTAEPEFRGKVTFQYVVCNPDATCFAPCDSAQVEIDVLNLPDPSEGLVLEDPGLNGQWVIKGLSGFTRVEVRILNRWGDVVYETEARAALCPRGPTITFCRRTMAPKKSANPRREPCMFL